MPDQLHINASLSAIQGAAGNQKRGPLDVWLDGTFGILADAKSTGSFAVGSLGADYMFNPQFILGAGVIVNSTQTRDTAGLGHAERPRV